tara:strand:- start:345 stop:869 length:525 start_codon:yes stop_codon:yes gene_type:complete
MNKIKLFIPIISIALFACSSTMPKSPKWFLNVPEEEGYLFSVGTEKGDEMQNALTEAELIAATDLQRRLDNIGKGTLDRVNEEINDRAAIDNFTDVRNVTYKVREGGYTLVERDYTSEGSIIRAYVLIKYDLNAAEKRLLDKIKKNKELNDALRSSQLYKEMEERVSKAFPDQD